MIKRFSLSVSDLFNSPLRVLTICFAFGFLTLILDGTLLRLWSLHREHDRIEQSISEIQTQSKVLGRQISKAKEMEFVERQARDRFDLVGENDLVFVFSNESD
jgi:cell division protein FtsB